MILLKQMLRKWNERYKMPKNQITREQHIIPRMILKRFLAPLRIPERTRFVYQYDKLKSIELKVEPKNICKVKNIYEFKDKQGNIIDRNYIENAFGNLEDKWSKILDKVEEQGNLSEEELGLLYLLVAVQILRTEEILKFNTDYVKKNYGDKLEELMPNISFETYTKIISFVVDVDNPQIYWMIDGVLKYLVKRAIFIYKSDYPFVLNTERPVFISKPINETNMSLIVFPISSFFAIVLNESKENCVYKNMSREWVQFINKHNFENEGRYVLCSESIYNLEELKEKLK